MYSSSSVAKPKLKIQVEVHLNDGAVLCGVLYRNPQQRVADLLNDDRAFLPFRDQDENLHILNKAFIVQVRPLEGDVIPHTPPPQYMGY